MNIINWPIWPEYGEEEQEAVARVIRSNQLFADREVRIFEEEFANDLGVTYAAGVGNATQGLHLALAALDIGQGDEVIVTPYSWISSASCVLMQNAVPIFCDIESDSLGLSPSDIERSISPRTKAIIVVHMFGYPARIHEIQSLSEKYGIPLIEDASHAHGASSRGRRLGSFGTISVFSLHQRKALPVGDGGIVCTSDSRIDDKIRRLRSFGHEELSYNYRMTEFAGAIGQLALRKVEHQNRGRSENARMIASLLAPSSGLSVRLGQSYEAPAFYAVLLDVSDDVSDLDSKLETWVSLGIPIRKTWSLLHLHPHFNPSRLPARGLPWKSAEYEGVMRNMTYSKLSLPVAQKHCPERVLELYVNPPAGVKEIAFAAEHLGALN